MLKNNGSKVEKETLAHCVDRTVTKTFFNFNIMVGFRATGIWPLNLERMEQKMEPLKTIYSIPSKKLIRHQIMEEDLPRGEENATHYFIKDEDEIELEGSDCVEMTTKIGQFLKLPQKEI